MGVFFEKKKQGFRFARTWDAYFQEIKNVVIFFWILVSTRKFREKIVFFSKNGKTGKNRKNLGKTGGFFWEVFWGKGSNSNVFVREVGGTWGYFFWIFWSKNFWKKCGVENDENWEIGNFMKKWVVFSSFFGF